VTTLAEARPLSGRQDALQYRNHRPMNRHKQAGAERIGLTKLYAEISSLSARLQNARKPCHRDGKIEPVERR
jgi:hypothetical protein